MENISSKLIFWFNGVIVLTCVHISVTTKTYKKTTIFMFVFHCVVLSTMDF
jgi:hypothetical protein